MQKSIIKSQELLKWNHLLYAYSESGIYLLCLNAQISLKDAPKTAFYLFQLKGVVEIILKIRGYRE